MKVLEKINKMVLEGKLPIAFFNSKIEIVKNKTKVKSFKRNTIPKYKQVDIPRPNPNKQISKIYEVF